MIASNHTEIAPAFAITTSSLPETVLISLITASFSSLWQDVSLTICTLPGNSLSSACRAVAAEGFRAPAKTTTFSRWARAVTSPKPYNGCQQVNRMLNSKHVNIPMPRFAPEIRYTVDVIVDIYEFDGR